MAHKVHRYVIADTHFGSYSVANICNRPFKTLKEMDETMIKRWNHAVKENDIIYHLGDFAEDDVFRLSENVKKYKARLNGRIRIILGNHDRGVPYSVWSGLGFDRVYDQPVVIDNFVILSHEPLYLNDLANSNAKAYLNIHGHVHGNFYANSHYVNVCVDKTHFFPVNLDKLIADTAEKIKTELESKEGIT